MEGKEPEKLTGVVEHIIYQNDENGYAVIQLEISEGEYETAFGTLPFISEGESLSAYGNYVVSGKYGRQFKIDSFEKHLPQSAVMIEKYLSSGTVKGIGAVMARKIVERFGDETFDVMMSNPEWLADIPGISVSRAKKIGEDFSAQNGMGNVMLFCSEFFPPSVSVRAFKRWGNSAVEVIRANPYSLCDEDFGVSFEKADNAAKKLGLPANGLDRIYAGIKYVLSHNANQNGHTYLPEEKLLPAVVALLGAEQETTGDALDMLVKTGVCCRERLGGKKCIFLKKYYDAEQSICNKLRLLEEQGLKVDEDNLKRAIDMVQLSENITYAPLQRKAIESAINSGVMVLTGGPGTGKTTVIRAITRILDRIDMKYALAAPTGRAAKRMSEATQKEAKTIHRLLEVAFGEGEKQTFIRNKNNLLDEDVIIIDEASMMDVILMGALLDAIKPGARLILIGDADQLPSVGAGNVLSDIITSDTVLTVHLHEIFRQAKESLIVTNAHAINGGEYPDVQTKNNDFFFMERKNEEDVANTVVELCKTRLPKKYGAEVLDTLQVITPTRMSGAGVESLNALLQAALNPPSPQKREKKAHGVIFRVGDKVMQTRNNYDIMWSKNGVEGTGIFNGDIGHITAVEPNAERIIIDFDDRITEYDFSLLDELEHAYAVTVHKSQGSEYKTVIIPVFKFSKRLLTRNLLYTAVTRAQKMVIIVGDSEVLNGMVDNNRHTMRYTSLSSRLSDFSGR